MLKLIRGAARAGKSEYVLKQIKERIKNNKRSVLIVPEQTNFFYEKKIATEITSASDLVEVVSFTNFAKKYVPEYKDISDIEKRIYMHLALNNTELDVYKRHYKTADFIEKMLEVFEETSSAKVDLLSFSDNPKYQELGRILKEYKRIANIKDILILAIDKLSIMKDTAIFIDDFSGFSKSQIDFIKALSEKCEEVNVCLIGLKGEFEYIDKTAKSLEPYELINIYPKTKPTDVEHFCFRPITTLTESFAVANLIQDLVENKNYRYKDIVVVAGSEDRLNKLRYSFIKNNIPAFFDIRSNTDSAMFFQGLISALNIASDTRTANIISLFKNPFCGLTEDEAFDLENYTYIWSLKTADFFKPFTKNPNGLLEIGKSITNEEKEKLESIEQSRKKLIDPIIDLSEALKSKTGKSIATGIYKYLQDINIKETFINKFSEDVLLRQNQYYSSLCSILDIIYNLPEDIKITPKDTTKLIDVALSSVTSALPPRHIDEVTCGIMNRMRIDEAKIVIIISAIKGLFPSFQSPIGLLNNSDRVKLNLCDNKEFAEKEKVFVYATKMAPSDKLYVMCPITELNGQKLFPSEFFDKKFECNLNEDCDESPEYDKPNHALTEKKVIDELYGKTMVLSSSKFEKFYGCPYSYFVNYGLNIKKLEKAELTAANRGTLLHYVLERIIPLLGKCDIKQKIDELINDYTSSYSLNTREKARYKRLSSWLYILISRLEKELKKEKFKPVRFELEINKDKEVTPLILKTKNGTEIFVQGKVDRVDIKKENDIKYLRVIDYKTSGKDISPTGIYNGINLQMLIYLFAILKNGKGELSCCHPSSVMYQPILGEYQSDEKKVEKQYEPSSIMLENDAKKVETLQKVVEDRLIEMAEKLENGYIESIPFVMPNYDPCKYCDYKYICGFTKGDPTRIPYKVEENV